MTARGDEAQAPAFPRFTVLDSWRGIAALGVAAGHANAATPFFGLAFFDHSRLLVDLFFVLSGFVIAGSYGERLVAGHSRGTFVWLRLGRIYPVHLAVLAAAVAVELAVLATGSGAITGRTAFGEGREPATLIAQLALVQVFWPPAVYSWTVQSWSISSEWVLYLLAALCWRPLGRHWWLASVLVGIAAGLAMFTPLGLEWSKLLRGLAGFGIGVGAFALWRRHGSALAAWPAGAATAAELAVVAALSLGLQFAPAAEPYLAYDLLFAGLVLLFAAERGRVSAWLRLRPFVVLGAISYSLYMVHTQAESALSRIAARLLPEGTMLAAEVPTRPPFAPHTGLIGDLGLAAVLAGAVLIAWVCHRVIERPAREWSRKRAGREPERKGGGGLAVI